MGFIKTLLDLCAFQAKPQDLPASQTLVIVTGLTTIITYILAHRAFGQPGDVIGFSVAQVVLFGFAVWAVLKLKRKPERFAQTITAIFGISTLMQLVAWPIVGWLSRVRGTPGAELPALLIMGLSIWVLAISVYVMKHALEVGIAQSLMITLGCQLFTLVLLFVLFGAPIQ